MDTFIKKLNNIQAKALSYDFSNDERRFVCIRLSGANGTGFLSEIEKEFLIYVVTYLTEHEIIVAMKYLLIPEPQTYCQLASYFFAYEPFGYGRIDYKPTMISSFNRRDVYKPKYVK